MKKSAAAALLVCASPAFAEDAKKIEEVIVYAHPLSAEGLSQASTVLEGNALHEKLGANIGETLALEPGVQSARFGKAVGRPVIRGLGGPRVRIMEDRIDTMDVSVTSADHAVAVDPFIAERIELLKGPSTLLYGSGAIGGVVDVHTGRIPHEVPAEGLVGGLESRYDENVDGFSNALKLNGGKGRFAWHADLSSKDGDDYDIPGFVESARLRALEEGAHEEEEHEEEVRGTLPGSAFESDSFAVGASLIDDWGFVGLSVNGIEAEYGLPGGHGHEEEPVGGEEAREEGTPTLEMEQTRFDFELGLNIDGGWLQSINVRAGFNDYEHEEIEPEGEAGTRFTNEAMEVRAEAVYQTDVWHGVFGLQHSDREYAAIGEEAFVPPVDTSESGVFWVAEREFETFDLEMGARLGRLEHDPQAGSSVDFNTYAVSLGAVAPLSDALRLSANIDTSSRAPVAEELFSDGPHLVTGSYELGNGSLDEEILVGLSLSLSYETQRFNANVGVYYHDFSDFIYEAATGAVLDGLPVFQFRQDDAYFYGLELDFEYEVTAWSEGRFGLTAMADLVEAEVDVSGNDNVPRLPARRAGLGLQVNHGVFRASVDYLRVFEQDDVTEFELATDEYDELRLYAGADWSVGRSMLGVFLRGTNLLDEEQREHVSFVKDRAPAPGRTFEVGVRLDF